MTPQEEADHYKYLKLKQKQAMATQSQAQPDNRTGLQKVSDKITNTLQTINNPGPAMQNAQMNEMGSQGDALFDKAGTAVTEYLGAKGVPSPIAAIPGTLISMANPQGWMTPAKVPGIPEMPGARKGVARVTEMLTGKSAQKVERLIKDPGVILPEGMGGAKSVPQASAEYGSALGKADLTKPKFSPFDGNKSAMDIGQNTWEKWRSGFGKIDPQEAYDATQAVKYAMPAAITERNVEKVNELMQFKDAMNNILENQKGKFKQASENYGRAKLKEDFSQWFPRTQTGKISTVKSLLMPSLVDPARAWMLGLTSPKVVGGAVAGGSAAINGLNVLGQNPAIRTTLLQVLSKIMKNKNGNTPK